MYDERIDGAPVIADEGLMVPAAPNTVGRTVIGVYWNGDKVCVPFDWAAIELAMRTGNAARVQEEVQPVFGTWEDYGIDALYKRAVAGEDIVLQYNLGEPGEVSCSVGSLIFGYARLVGAGLLMFYEDYEKGIYHIGYLLEFQDNYSGVIFYLEMRPDGSVEANVEG